MKQTVGLGFVLLALWLALSGHWEPLLLGFGVLSCIIVVAVVLRMDVVDHETMPFRLTARALVYLPWLLWEIVKANLDVCRRILHPRLPISPRMVRIRASQRDEFGQVIFANSITLTPGTISTGVHEGEITVHALTAEAAAGLTDGEMDRRVSAAVDPR